jgi:hypothetical protein
VHRENDDEEGGPHPAQPLRCLLHSFIIVLDESVIFKWTA